LTRDLVQTKTHSGTYHDLKESAAVLLKGQCVIDFLELFVNELPTEIGQNHGICFYPQHVCIHADDRSITASDRIGIVDKNLYFFDKSLFLEGWFLRSDNLLWCCTRIFALPHAAKIKCTKKLEFHKALVNSTGGWG
jgi:hypothetical protein